MSASRITIRTEAVYIAADAQHPVEVLNAGAHTAYHKNAPDVDSGDTALAAAATVELTDGAWFVVPSASTELNVRELDNVNAGDDLIVAGTADIAGVTTPSGGVAPPAAVPGFYTWQPPTAESGTDVAFAEKKLFMATIFIPVNKSIKGIGFLLGAGGGTNKVIAALFDAAGKKLANTSEATEGTVAGTEKTAQEIDLTAPYTAVGPAVYVIGITANGATAKLRTIPANTAGSNIHTIEDSLATKNVVPAEVTPPSAFVAAKGPVAWVY